MLLTLLVACEPAVYEHDIEHIPGDDDNDGYTEAEGDCDLDDGQVNPGEPEVWYDGVDQNCDGNDDDQDGDGVAVADDCDDTQTTVLPGGTEVCDELDNDCNGTADDGVGDLWGYTDLDTDGFGTGELTQLCGTGALPAGYAAVDGDCDDARAEAYPDAPELCNELDDDCDSEVDEGAADLLVYFADTDADGFGAGAGAESCTIPDGYVDNREDCDDANVAIHPGVDEACDGVDQDCDGRTDEEPVDGVDVFLDEDLDGYGSVATTACALDAGYADNADDCDDADAFNHPGAFEVCDTIDNDCDGENDEEASDAPLWYVDGDGDGYGDDDTSTRACEAPAGTIAGGGDCDDTDLAVNPDAGEVDDGVDDDCDGIADEDFVAAGDLVITEVARQPRMGGGSTDTTAQWFEVLNVSTRDVALGGWLVQRSSSVATDQFRVDPLDDVVVAAGAYAVLCKTDDWTAASVVESSLSCDYIWGDESESATYAGTYHDNTFNLQRDEDTLALYVDALAVDSLSWVYTSPDLWPREAAHSMSLDPGKLTAAENDGIDSWCVAPEDSVWWDDADDEYGTPGALNDACP